MVHDEGSIRGCLLRSKLYDNKTDHTLQIEFFLFLDKVAQKALNHESQHYQVKKRLICHFLFRLHAQKSTPNHFSLRFE